MQKIIRHRLQTLKSASITFDYIGLDNVFQKPVMSLGIIFFESLTSNSGLTMNCNIVLYTNLILFSIILSPKLIYSDVKCGAHRAETCRECIHGYENPYLRKYLWYMWCNEDCVWDPITKLCNGIGKYVNTFYCKE